MNKLLQAGLYGGGLVAIDDPNTVANYNKCLRAIGKPETKLSSFNVDGRGWSPEIAEEIRELDYLKNGDANPYAILVTPAQKGLPIYHPHHSFDRDLLKCFFKLADRQIADLTSETALWIELDHFFDQYSTPDDLVMMESVIVRTHSIGDFMDAARNQRALIHHLSMDDNWSNDSLRNELIRSATEHGDLRHRSFIIEDIPYMRISSFHMRVFGGVYVFREAVQKTPALLIFEDSNSGFSGRCNELLLNDSVAVLERLHEEGLVSVCLNRFKEKPQILHRLKDSILNRLIFDAETENEEFDMCSLNTAQRSVYIQLLRDELASTCYRELDVLSFNIQRGEMISTDSLSSELQRLLFRPAVDPVDNPVMYDLLMNLLVTILPMPSEVMYAFNKPYFFQEYEKWTEAQKKWAIIQIERNRLERANGKR